MSYGNYPNLEKVEKILVIKLRNIGDVLLTTPLLRVLKKKFPKAAIDFYINEESFPLVKQNPYIEEVILYDRKRKKGSFFSRYGYEISLLRKIRKKKYDLVVNLTEGDRGSLAVKAAKASICVGKEGMKKGFWNREKLYTHIVKNCPTPKHTVEKDLDILRKIGIHPPYEERELSLSICKEAMKKVETYLKENEIGPFFLIHPTARWRFKCYPEKKWGNISCALLEKGFSLLFSAGPSSWEKEMIHNIVTTLPQNNVFDLSGKITLEELAIFIAKSEMLLCVDSAPFHMASALKHKVIALFGPSSDTMWGAWRNPYARVLFQDLSCRPCLMDGCGGSKKSDCLETLSESRVLQEIEALLKTSSSLLQEPQLN